MYIDDYEDDDLSATENNISTSDVRWIPWVKSTWLMSRYLILNQQKVISTQIQDFGFPEISAMVIGSLLPSSTMLKVALFSCPLYNDNYIMMMITWCYKLYAKCMYDWPIFRTSKTAM